MTSGKILLEGDPCPRCAPARGKIVSSEPVYASEGFTETGRGTRIGTAYVCSRGHRWEDQYPRPKEPSGGVNWA